MRVLMLKAMRIAAHASRAPAIALRAASTSTHNPEEVSKFSKLARLWWDEDSAAFGALHRMNQVRVPIVVEAAKAAAAARGDTGVASVGRTIRPLAHTAVLDVGCGGGILAEVRQRLARPADCVPLPPSATRLRAEACRQKGAASASPHLAPLMFRDWLEFMQALARVGADVTGLDASAENVAAAAAHSMIDPEIGERVLYEQLLVEDLAAQLSRRADSSPGDGHDGAAARAPDGGFDVVVSSEVVEHVNSPALFVAALAACLRPGGVLVMTTITRTALSYAGAIFAAEQVAGLVPPGTHDFAKFLRPEELSGMMADAGLEPAAPEPIAYNPVTGQWSRGGGRVVMQYALSATKPLL